MNKSFYSLDGQYNVTIIRPDNGNSSEDTKLLIDQIAFIYYGYNIDENFTC